MWTLCRRQVLAPTASLFLTLCSCSWFLCIKNNEFNNMFPSAYYRIQTLIMKLYHSCSTNICGNKTHVWDLENCILYTLWPLLRGFFCPILWTAFLCQMKFWSFLTWACFCSKHGVFPVWKLTKNCYWVCKCQLLAKVFLNNYVFQRNNL